MKWTVIIAMVLIAGLEAIALLKGIDGAVFGIVITALAGLGGFALKSLLVTVKGGG